MIGRGGSGNHASVANAGLALQGLATKVDTHGSAHDRTRALMVLHFDFVWRLLCRLGVPRAEVDDAAQNVFIVVAQRLDEVSAEKERTFLYGTALRMAATLRRNRGRRMRLEATLVDDAARPALPDEVLERRRALALLDEVLNGLDAELREVFVLSEIEELSASEVAAIAGIPAGTVASRLRRARQKFDERVRRLQAQRDKTR
jgi:RNA polymerase sigma-70 factor (ECF subfamily)